MNTKEELVTKEKQCIVCRKNKNTKERNQKGDFSLCHLP